MAATIAQGGSSGRDDDEDDDRTFVAAYNEDEDKTHIAAVAGQDDKTQIGGEGRCQLYHRRNNNKRCAKREHDVRCWLGN